MGLALPAFLVAWTVMMAAMMLPSVAPVASLYSRSIVRRRARRLTLVHGRLPGRLGRRPASWRSRSASLVADLAGGRRRLWTAAGVAAYLACGVYQLSPLKYRCLAHCRSPLSLFFHYARTRVRCGTSGSALHHGAYCLGCCWGLMVVLLALGAHEPRADAHARYGRPSPRSSGRGARRSPGSSGSPAWSLAVATIWIPGLAPGFTTTMPDM